MQTIVIFSALRKELEPLLVDIQKKEQIAELNGITFYSGNLKGVSARVIFGSFGIGKVLATLTTQFLIDTCKPQHIFLIGGCGGAIRGISPGDIIVSDSTIQSDIDISCFGYSKGEFKLDSDENKFREFKTNSKITDWLDKDQDFDFVPIKKRFPNIIRGRMISQDTFETKKEIFRSLYKEFNFLGIDMESAAVNVVCDFNGVPCNVVKSVVDIVGQLDMKFYREYYTTVCVNTYILLKTYLVSKNI